MTNKFQNLVKVILNLPRHKKRTLVVVLDISLCIFATWLALYIRLDQFIPLNQNYAIPTMLSIITLLPIMAFYGLYRQLFRYSGISAILAVSRAFMSYSIIYASIVTAFGIVGVPRTLGLLQPLILLFFIIVSRLTARQMLSEKFARTELSGDPVAFLIYGTGEQARQVSESLSNDPNMRLKGFVDDDPKVQAQTINGHTIFPTSQLKYLLENSNIKFILLALPNASSAHRRKVLNSLAKHNIEVRTLPSIRDIIESKSEQLHFKELDIADLLDRETVEPNTQLLEKNILGKNVCVTGAGGSIGSELCRQILILEPKKLILFEISEYNLYITLSELKALQDNHPKANLNTEIIPILGSVQDYPQLKQAIASHKPHTVYHAAAYKHVALVENNLIPSLKNNVLGTINVGKICIECNVNDLVLISTDKAVKPTNIMGASKRLAEISMQALYAAQEQPLTTTISIVRFGNVLDSSGSVIPKFRQQVKAGGPITLTHPEVTRYFMTIPEAAQLVIQASGMAKGGEVFILEMGAPVKIKDLAHRIINLSGKTVCDLENPNGDIEIKITGLSNGEKLHEELFLTNNRQTTDHPKISSAQEPFEEWQSLAKKLNLLESYLNANKERASSLLLKDLVKCNI